MAEIENFNQSRQSVEVKFVFLDQTILYKIYSDQLTKSSKVGLLWKV